MARRKAPCIGNGARTKTPVAPDGRPAPSVWREEGKTGLSRASTKNRGGGALANPAEALLKAGCLTIESMKHVSSSDLILTSVALLLRFRRVPERIHLCKRRVLRPLVTRGEGALDRGKALLEFEVGVTQYAFGISGEMTRQIDHREQQIADFLLGVVGCAGIKRVFDLVGLLADLGEHGARIVPVEADTAGFILQLQ